MAFSDVKLSDVNICETAGFVPLDVRFKRLEQSGYVAQFFTHQFDTDDIRQIFMGEETQIYADDDEDIVRIKLYKQNKLREKILRSKLGDLAEEDDEEGRQDDRGSSGSKPPSQKS